MFVAVLHCQCLFLYLTSLEVILKLLGQFLWELAGKRLVFFAQVVHIVVDFGWNYLFDFFCIWNKTYWTLRLFMRFALLHWTKFLLLFFCYIRLRFNRAFVWTCLRFWGLSLIDTWTSWIRHLCLFQCSCMHTGEIVV